MWHKLQYSTVHWACRMNQFGEHKLTDDARIKMSIVFLKGCTCLDWTSRAPSRQSIILSPSTGLARTLGKKKWQQKKENFKLLGPNDWWRWRRSVSNFEFVQRKSSVFECSQVVMYCCGAVPRIEFWIWLNIDVEKLLENEWQHNKRPLACYE